MTDMNEDDNMNTTEKMRFNRRKILKGGAVMVPLAVTLHGGIPLAHALSASCEQKMEENQFQIPHFLAGGDPDPLMSTTPYVHDQFTGREFNGVPETHWDFISIEGNPGHSCWDSLNPNGI